MQKITPFLWFNDNLEEAIACYTSVFNNSAIVSVQRSGDALPGEKGKAFTATVQLAGSGFYALNGGPMFSFTPAISLFVNCETVEEIDAIWNKLSDGGKVLMPLATYPFSERFGWVQDRFGLSWQLNLTRTPQKITPFLMFVKDQDGKAEAAMNYYVSLFKNAQITQARHYGPGQGGAEGTLLRGAFSLDGTEFMAMDSSGPHEFTFTPAFSFFVNCDTQDEVDYFWEHLSAGGRKDRCGWVSDKYGISWQIVPSVLLELLYGGDAARAARVMQAMLKMDKLEFKGLEEA